MTYTVAKGDNLTKIAKKYDATVAELVTINNIKNPDKIYVGQVLEIPGASAPKVEATVDKPSKSLMDEFLEHVRAQLGMPYVWGAQGHVLTDMPDPEGWIRKKEDDPKDASNAIEYYRKVKTAGMNPIRAYDCSGLIMSFVENKKGLRPDLPARYIYSDCDPIDRGDLQPGDLVFRHNGKKIHHVGVYVGEGRVIEAMGRKYGVVDRRIDASGSGYWNRYGRWKILSR